MRCYAAVMDDFDLGDPKGWVTDWCRANDPTTMIDDSMEFGIVHVVQVSWKRKRCSVPDTDRRECMSSDTYAALEGASNARYFLRSADLLEIDTPFGPPPIPRRTLLEGEPKYQVMFAGAAVTHSANVFDVTGMLM